MGFSNDKLSLNKDGFDYMEELIKEIEKKDNGSHVKIKAVDEGQIEKWEKNMNIFLPNDYKNILRTTMLTQVDTNLLELYTPHDFKLLEYQNSIYLKLGEFIGDGEMLLYSLNNKKYIGLLDGRVVRDFERIEDILLKTKKILDYSFAFLNDTAELILDMINIGAIPRELKKFLELLKNDYVKESIDEFNSVDANIRRWFLSKLTKEQVELFIDIMRRYSVVQFWNNERRLINEGQCTREWTAEQIETIMNISLDTGNFKENARPANEIRFQGNNGHYYIARHIYDILKRPEYAGEPRNIQALDHNEYVDSVMAVYGVVININEI